MSSKMEGGREDARTGECLDGEMEGGREGGDGGREGEMEGGIDRCPCGGGRGAEGVRCR